MKLYHGTPERNARAIEEEGFIGSTPESLIADQFYLGGEVVYMTADIDEAREYGEAIFEVNLEGVEAHEYSDGNTTHFYADAREVNEQAWWVRV